MLYAEIRLTKKNHVDCGNFIKFITIFGNIEVPKNRIFFFSKVWAFVPMDEFGYRGYNPCQLINGYLDIVEI